jgi:hypothetical protein
MWGHEQDGRQIPDAAQARALSRNAIIRFCCTVFFLVVWLLREPQHLVNGTFAGAMSGVAAVTAILALVLREPFRGPALNRWDEPSAISAWPRSRKRCPP